MVLNKNKTAEGAHGASKKKLEAYMEQVSW